MTYARALVGASHPLPALAVTTVTALLAVGLDLTGRSVIVLVVAVLTGQLSIGWSNDAIDATRDEQAGRRDKPAATGAISPRLVGGAALLAVAASILTSAALTWAAAAAALTLVAAGWAYNAGLKRTLASGLAYVVGFGALPAAAYLEAGRPVPWWVPVTGALLGLGAHFANTLPDLDDDRAAGINGLPQRLGPSVGVIVMAAVLAAAAVVLALGPPTAGPLFTPAVAGIGVVIAAFIALCAARVPDRPVAFRLTMLLAVFDVAVVVTVAAT